MAQPDPLHHRPTPIHAQHRALGARMIECAGWEMPLAYTGIAAEHLAVRARAGLFDVSPLGQIEIAGRDALAAVQWVTSNDASRLAVGDAQPSALLSASGTFVEDLLVFRLADRHFLLVVGAAGPDRAAAWIRDQAGTLGDVIVLDTSARYAVLALEGPLALDVFQRVTDIELAAIKYYGFVHGEVGPARVTVARASLSGEDGFLVFVPPRQASATWEAILGAGRDEGVVPAGLGARDTLRLEAGIPLGGLELDAASTPLEAGLDGVISWDKGDFLGREALVHQRECGVSRRLVGFELDERAIARRGHPVTASGLPAGPVTSGTMTPFLKRAIGMAYVPVQHAAPGTPLEIEIRGRRHRARVVSLPFYTRPKG